MFLPFSTHLLPYLQVAALRAGLHRLGTGQQAFGALKAAEPQQFQLRTATARDTVGLSTHTERPKMYREDLLVAADTPEEIATLAQLLCEKWGPGDLVPAVNPRDCIDQWYRWAAE